MDSWWKRVRNELDRKGWSVVEFERRTGIDKGLLYKYVTGEVVQPRGDAYARMALALRVNEHWLRTGEGMRSSDIAVIGRLSSMEQWTGVSVEKEGEFVDFSLPEQDSFAIEIVGSSMSPVYRDGDMVICSRRYSGNLDSMDTVFRRRDCVVKTIEGVGYCKMVSPGSRSGVFTLRSYNPDYPEIENVALEWIAPVAWIKRGG